MRRASTRLAAVAVMSAAALIVAAALGSLGSQAHAQSTASSKSIRADLGAKLTTVTPQLAKERHLLPFGALVTEVIKGGAAEKANLAADDLIQVINDEPVQSAQDVQRIIDQLAPGAEVRLTFVRAGQITQGVLTLAAVPVVPVTVAGNPVLMLDTGGHMALIRSVIFTRDGKQIISAADDKVIRVWDWRTSKTVRTIRGEIGPARDGTIYAMALSPDQRWLAAGGWFDKDSASQPCCGDIRLYDFASGRLVRLIKGHTSIVTALAFSPDSKLLLSGSGLGDHSARLWDVESGRMLQRLDGHNDVVYAVGFSPDGARMITGGYDHNLRLWRTDNGSLITEMKGHTDKVQTIAVRKSDGMIASSDYSGEIRLWDGRTGRALRTLTKQPGQPWSLSFSPDGTKLLSTCGYACSGYRQHVFDINTGNELVTYSGNDSTVLASAITADGKLAATGGGESFPIQVWELANGHRIAGANGQPVSLSGTGAQIWAVGFSKDSKRIGWGTVWQKLPGGTGHSSETGSPLSLQLRLPNAGESLGAPEALPASEDTNDFVRAKMTLGDLSLMHRPGGTYGYNNAILDVRRNGKVIASLERDAYDGYGHWAYTFSADGRYVISGGANGQLYSYDLAGIEAAAKGGTLKGNELWKHEHGFVGHEGVVWALTPSPDGRYLISGDGDQTARLWNMRTQELIVTIFRGTDGEWAIWTPQGYYASSPKGEALVGWNLNRGRDKEGQWVTAEQLRSSFYRPDVVARAVGLGSATDALREANLTLTAADALMTKSLPVIHRVVWPAAGTSATGGKGIITVAVEKSAAPPTNWTFTLRGFADNAPTSVNARPVATPAGHPPVASDEDLYAFEIPLHKGQNLVNFFASNANGDSQKWEYPIFHDGDGDLDQRGTLHILAVGVDRYPDAAPLQNLNFAGRDALEFAQTAAQAMRGHSKDVHIETLCQIQGCTAEPTKDNIIAALNRIAAADALDTIVVFLAGHGESGGGKYYFLPTDFKRTGTDLRSSPNALDWSQIANALGRAGSKLLFVDACHSGASFNATLLNDARQKSVIAFSSAGPNQLSWEDSQVKHGLFTYWLIKGLSGEALERDHTVKVYGLGNFLAQKVGEYTERAPFSRQEPVFASLLDSNPAIAWH